MKPYTITIPFTVTFDPAAAELAELARFIVTRLTDEGALDEAAEHGHGIMATSAAIEWARERLGNQIPAVPEPAPNAGDSALYGAGETLEQLARTGELDRAAGLEHVLELPSGDTVRFAATDEAADLLAVATEGRRMIRTPQVKVVEADADGHGAVVEMRPDGSLWFWPEGAFGEDAATDISSALPFLPGLKPGDTVYLLDGFTQSVDRPDGLVVDAGQAFNV